MIIFVLSKLGRDTNDPAIRIGNTPYHMRMF